MKTTVERLREAGELLSPVIETTIDTLERGLLMAHARIRELERRIGLNSRNSSLPPSQDPPGVDRPSPKTPKKKRRKGGQPGHRAHHRSLLPPERVDHTVDHWPSACAHCQTPLPAGVVEIGVPEQRQMLELPPIRVEVTEHRLHHVRCPVCRKVTGAVPPAGIGPGTTFGSRLTALSATLTVRLRASRRNLHAVLGDLLDVPAPCPAQIQKLLFEVSRSTLPAYREARRALRHSPAIHVDETGWRCKGERYWLWTGATKRLSVFRLTRHRSRLSLFRLIGRAYGGIVTSDRYSAYGARDPDLRQLCWAHLARDFLDWQSRGPAAARVGVQAEAEAHRLFHLWHEHQRGEVSRADLRRKLRPLQARFTRLLYRGAECGESRLEKTCTQLLIAWPALWSFVVHKDARPTNNEAERSLRSGVIWRKTSFGSQSERGLRFVERLLTLAETCRKQQKNLLEYLTEALSAARAGSPPPALIPTL